MSIVKQISTLPDTRISFDSNVNNMGQIKGVFVTQKDFYFSSSEDLLDFDIWFQALGDDRLIPLHGCYEVDNLSEETIYNESIQDYTYESRPGKLRYKLKYNWTIDYYQIVESLSGTDLYVIIYDTNNNIYATKDGSTYRGFKTSHIQLEKLYLQIGQNPAFSPLDIEWYDSNEWIKYGVVKHVDWMPQEIDRIFTTINVEYADSNNLNFSARWLSNPVIDIEQSGVSLTDDVNGSLSFGLYSYSGGVYRMSNFSGELVQGTLRILSNAYIGCATYRVIAVVIITNYLLFEDGDRLMLENGDLLILDNNG